MSAYDNKPTPPAFGGGDAAAMAAAGALAGGGVKTVATPTTEVLAHQPDWTLASTLLGGTRAMRAAGATYLPQFPSESTTRWQRRLALSTLFPAFRRTITTLAARPFSKPLTIDEALPKELREWAEKDVDLQGQSLHDFGGQAMRLALSHGFGGIFVDHKVNPAVAAGSPRPTTRAEEKQAGLRPYMVLVPPERIIGWRFTITNGNYRLTQLRFMECVKEPDGEWDEKDVDQVRVLEPGKWTTYRKLSGAANNGAEQWVKHDNGITTNMDEIPFVPIYGERCGFMNGRSPLLELAHLNIKHWQSQSDQDNLLHVARVPLLVLTGVQEEDPDKPFTLVLGTGGAIRLPDGATLTYTEHTGAAIEAGKSALDDLKEDMRQSGAELLVLKPGPTTATEVASDNAVGMCDLQRAALEIQSALNSALALMAKWTATTLPEGKVFVKVFLDFGAATLAEASASLLVGMANSGKLSNETLFSELKRRGILSPDIEYEDEQERIERQPPTLTSLPPAPGGPPRAPGVPPKPTPAPTPAPRKADA